jgi:hypothetical protein
MKKQLLTIITVFTLFLLPTANFGQAPDLGVSAPFALFTASGALGNSGFSTITGDIGSNSASVTGFPPGTISGTIFNPPNALLAQAATDVDNAYSYLAGMTCDAVIVTTLEGQVLTSGVYCTGAAASLNGDITLDGEGNPNALFIIQIGGALTIGSFSTVTLINAASLCNVYWQIGGQFDLGANSVFRGTALVDGAIYLLEASSLLGRALSRAGEISLNNNIVRFSPDAAGAITGTVTVCQGQTAEMYSVPEIAEAESYSWTLPAGATGTSTTNSISVNYGTSATSGDISVTGYNSCGGDGIASVLSITVNPLPITSTIYHE